MQKDTHIFHKRQMTGRKKVSLNVISEYAAVSMVKKVKQMRLDLRGGK